MIRSPKDETVQELPRQNVLPSMFLSRNNLIFVKFILVIFFFFKTGLLVGTSVI